MPSLNLKSVPQAYDATILTLVKTTIHRPGYQTGPSCERSGAAGLDSSEQLIPGQLRHHEDLLGRGAFASEHLETACHRYRYTQLQA